MPETRNEMHEPQPAESAPIPLVEVCTTCGSRDQAERLAERLVGERLAACVQVEGPITSRYVWEGRSERAEEWRCTCKTTAGSLAGCVAAIRRLHDYATPQIVVRSVRASADYGGWVEASVGAVEASDDASAWLTFDIVVHPRPVDVRAGGDHADDRGRWPTLVIPPADLVEPLPIGFDECSARLDALPRLFVEPDGSFVWRGEDRGGWQVDGNLYERDGCVLYVELKGTCPAAAFDRLASAWGWPTAAFVAQLVRAGVFLDEATFRRHAAARGGQTG